MLVTIFYNGGVLSILLIIIMMSAGIIGHKLFGGDSARGSITENDIKHLADVYDLIDKDKYSKDEEKESSKKQYVFWVKNFRDIYKNSSEKSKKLRATVMEKNNYHDYVPGQAISEMPGVNMDVYEVLSGFTDIFPSTHDMDDWALATRVAEIFILKDISKIDRKRSVVWIKKHYVNHQKFGAIIEFNLYLHKTT